MKVQVHRFANLRAYGPPGEPAELDLPQGAPVSQALERLGLPQGVRRVVLVNGHSVPEDQVLAGGDVLTLFPPVEGG